MDTLSAENMVRENNIGKIFFLPKEYLELLCGLSMFKLMQTWLMFKTLATFMREESLELAKLIQNIE